MSEPHLEFKPNRAEMSWIDHVVWFCITNKLLVILFAVFVTVWGIIVAPFDWQLDWLPRNPIPVDAIPDIGENQQIVFTEWPGRSPQDVEDQITYPLTVSLLGVPGVKTVRSFSFFGFSSIYIVFEEGIEFYWSRSRILEKLNSLPAGTLPADVQPALGPDATALGQVFWYTLEGRSPSGEPVGGWDLHELRTIQDWYVRFGLLSAEGVSEVASVGGFVQEYQIDVDPDAMRANRVTLPQIFNAVRRSNVDVGARTIEVNRIEYVIRGLGLIKTLEDIEKTVITVNDNVPIHVENVADVTLGPALRRGVLDKAGAEAVGGVVVGRYGTNPLATIKNVKAKMAEIGPGLPVKPVVDSERVAPADVAQFAAANGFQAYTGAKLNEEAWLHWLRDRPESDWPHWITTSQVTIVPFYDRTGLIYETLGTLNAALIEEMLVSVIVVLVMVRHFGSSLLISGLLPIAVLMCFIAMSVFDVDANIVALSGIAIAIGTMVDMGVIICENVLRRLHERDETKSRLQAIFEATSEVGGAIVTAVMTTVISFLPVFTMIGAEGKLFKPLAFTKTFALIASVIVALIVIPPLAHLLFERRFTRGHMGLVIGGALVAVGVGVLFVSSWWLGAIIIGFGIYYGAEKYLNDRVRRWASGTVTVLAIFPVAVYLAARWMPLGVSVGFARNFVFVILLFSSVLGALFLLMAIYRPTLHWCLRHKSLYLLVTAAIVLLGGMVWVGANRVFGFIPATAAQIGLSEQGVRQTSLWQGVTSAFPGLGKEFMPPLDEGSFLFMPTTMPHASIGEALDVLQFQDKALAAIPEVDSVVGKIGRIESSLDPAPVSMVETTISYVSEYASDERGEPIRYRYDTERDQFVRDEAGRLIEDPSGQPFRQWREHISSPDDIWDEILRVTQLPGTTSAPKLQPIAARLVMLQSGMRAPMGVKIKGPDLATIERFGLELEKWLQEVPGVTPESVIADRIVGKPYLEIDIDREAIARYGIQIQDVQDVIEVAIGGRRVTMTVEGRERYPVRIRYKRELRDEIEKLGRILVPGATGVQIPLTQLADIRFVRGPQSIKSEDTFLVGYVLFDKQDGYAEVDVVEASRRYFQQRIDSGELVVPAGVSYSFAGSYENQIRSQRTLRVVLPLALFIIFIILYLQFRSVITATLVFSGIVVAWAGGFLLIWLYGQPWFLDVNVFDTNLRELFQVQTINLSVAIWVGFLALFGIASDNGVVIATYLDQCFAERRPTTREEIRAATVEGAMRRLRPCLMTTGTTVLALLPILTSTGRGSDIMVPMAIPSFGGMVLVLITVFLVPVLYCWVHELGLRWNREVDASASADHQE